MLNGTRKKRRRKKNFSNEYELLASMQILDGRKPVGTAATPYQVNTYVPEPTACTTVVPFALPLPGT